MHKLIELNWYSDAKFCKAVACYCLLSDLYCLKKGNRNIGENANSFQCERVQNNQRAQSAQTLERC